MPDWITHVGTTYLVSQTLPARWVALRPLLVGAVLPDATRFVVILVDVLDWPAIDSFTYFIPFHSLLLIAPLAAIIALLLPVMADSGIRTFGWLMAGSAFHFLLDDLEGPIGCGSTTLYPVYFGKPLNLWDSGGNAGVILLLVSAMGIGIALTRRGHWSPLVLMLTGRRMLTAGLLLGVVLLTPLFFRTWMLEQNAYYLDVVVHPAAYEGQTVELCFSEVIATEPPTIEEFDTPFELTEATLIPGEWVSVRGSYQDGRIAPSLLVRHRGFSDVTLSLVAVVALAYLLFDVRTFWKGTYGFRDKRP